MTTPTLEQVPPLSLAGRTLRWKFNDGPTGGTVYEHTFKPDGTVVFRSVGGEQGKSASATEKKPAGKPAPIRYAAYEVAPGWHLVSYLAPESGYTLTVLVNMSDGALHGFASNQKEWYPLTGTQLPEE